MLKKNVSNARERLYKSAAKAFKVKELKPLPLTEEQALNWGKLSPEGWDKYIKSEEEQIEAWVEIRSLPFGR